jgi:hypothetical protein
LSAAFWNSNVRDNSLALRDGTGQVPPMVIVRRAAVQSVANNTITAVSFDTQDVDTDACFAPTSTNITINTTGIYLLTSSVQFGANAVGLRELGFQNNGTIINTGAGPLAANTPAHSGASVITVTGMVSLTATDIVTLYAYQNSGGALNIQGRASIVLLGRTS